jgi:hypothetical protein
LALSDIVACTCSDCVELNVFLRTTERSIDFAVSAQRRQHLHQMLESQIGDHIVSHVSQWSGGARVLHVEKIFDTQQGRKHMNGTIGGRSHGVYLDDDSSADDLSGSDDEKKEKQPQHGQQGSGSGGAIGGGTTNSSHVAARLDPEFKAELHQWITTLGFGSIDGVVAACAAFNHHRYNGVEVPDTFVNAEKFEVEERFLSAVKHVLRAYHHRSVHHEVDMNAKALFNPMSNRVRVETEFRRQLRLDLESGVLRNRIVAWLAGPTRDLLPRKDRFLNKMDRARERTNATTAGIGDGGGAVLADDTISVTSETSSNGSISARNPRPPITSTRVGGHGVSGSSTARSSNGGRRGKRPSVSLYDLDKETEREALIARLNKMAHQVAATSRPRSRADLSKLSETDKLVGSPFIFSFSAFIEYHEMVAIGT